MTRQRTAIASPECFQPCSSVTTQRLVSGHTLREQQSLDPVYMLDPFGDQDIAFTANTTSVLFLGSWRHDHNAHPGFAALERQQRAKQRLAVNPVGLRSPAPT